MKSTAEARKKISRRTLLAATGTLTLGALGAAVATRHRLLGLLGDPGGLEVTRLLAMGTYLDVTVAEGAEPEAVRRAASAVAALERALSVFRPESELSRLNAVASRADAELSADLRTVLEQSERVHRLTDGAFDPTVEPLMGAWGFRQGRPTHRPSREQLRDSLEQTGWQRVRLSDGRIHYDAEHLAIDLGGIGKGFAADRAATALATTGRSGLVNAGGDIRAAGAHPEGGPWLIGVRHPVRPNELLAKIALGPSRAVATSGTYEQRYSLEGREVSHVLDPRSGEPVDSVVSATVVAPTALEADALATAACVLGAPAALKLFATLESVEALILSREGRGYRLDGSDGLEVELLARA